MCVLGYAAILAHAEGGSEIPGQIKELATGNGPIWTLVSILCSAVGVLFALLMKSSSGKDAALKAQTVEHLAAIKVKDDEHNKDRVEWFAQLQMLQEARAGQLREVLTACNAATATIASNNTILAERNQTAAEVTAGLASVVSALQSFRSSSTDDMSSNRRQIVELTERIDGLAKRLVAAV